MSYFTPYIDETGLHIPTYTDIRDALVDDAKNIFGQDIYIREDSQDYQWVSAVAAYIYDTFQVAQIVYNGRSPSTSIGATLDSIVKLNGIVRKPAQNSTCEVVLSGVAGAPIKNGLVQDINGNLWDLPSDVVLNASGTKTVIATCQVSGAIAADIGDISTIATPTYGWNSVINNVAATVGTNTETDSELRIRQAKSVNKASVSNVSAIKNALSLIDGVTKIAVYENDTNNTVNSMVPHSITAVIEGGSPVIIGKTIINKKSPGCATNGNQGIETADDYGTTCTVNYYRPSYVDIDVTITLRSISTVDSTLQATIKQSVSDYLNGMDIGADLSISALWGVVLATQNIKSPIFSITSLTAGKHGMTQGGTDIVIAPTELLRGQTGYITLNIT